MAKRKLRTQNTTQIATPAPRRLIEFTPRNLTQAKMLRALHDEQNHMVFALGAAGTGKSYIAAKYAIQQFLLGRYKRIVITRPTVEAGETLGLLPGGIEEKMHPWLLPIYDIFMEDDGISKNEIKSMIGDGRIEIAPLQLLRGRTLKDCVIICDEMQNAETNQLKMLLTRIGEDSKMIITGDMSQNDRRKKSESGLEEFMYKLSVYGDVAGIQVIKFTDADCVRHPIIKTILDIYGE